MGESKRSNRSKAVRFRRYDVPATRIFNFIGSTGRILFREPTESSREHQKKAHKSRPGSRYNILEPSKSGGDEGVQVYQLVALIL